MTPEQLSTAVRDVLAAAVDAGEVSLPDGVPDRVTVERPRNREHGDYATNVAMQLAKKAGANPRALAELLAARLRAVDGVTAVDVAGPGFLNITVSAAAQGELARTVVEQGAEYGRADVLTGTRLNIEFISANPTGPLHLGHVRWAAVGDAMARVLDAAGADVTREFYINDRGAQMDKFGASIMARAHGRDVPDDGYHGSYVGELARAIVEDQPGITELPEDEQLVAFREAGYQRQLAEQQRQLDEFRTRFDVWYSERTLHDGGRVEHALDVLRGKGHVFEADGAVWMRTTDFGDDKDRVLVRTDGGYTYFAADTAYYVDKRERGFDVCIYLLGADHHGYVGRLRAIAACAGDDADRNIEIPIGQMVKILDRGEELKLSKRAGTMITLGQVVDAAGVDALRYSLCRYPADSPLTLDVAQITKHTPDNPVFYVQYAHARLSSILRNAADLGVDRGELDPSMLNHERESVLLGALAEFPRVVATAAELREPHRIARYMEDVAGTFHRFYDDCRVLPMGDEDATDVHRARLWLVDATRVVLANGLGLLGVAAPERM
ncbi:arginyl-tRNA synthetase [Haloactinopolyspora alba]|uniref:Arginine--tRNA ligase n=1 Tax=Haloactinopolyspora alba TaxID=648780 RepID=A0A2P8EB50_9ACTN|nr:arginine--tRNA ligase [Haloactinopolyspora alba]PSL06691.1 arginyl-tRNA synthetase [Haloactinopolyspora alba]